MPSGLQPVRRHPDRPQLAGQQQPSQQLGILAIGLDAIWT
jgi:hypothetical protein